MQDRFDNQWGQEARAPPRRPGQSLPSGGPPNPPSGWNAHTDAKIKFLRDWKLMKRARFNAAKRYESKQDASVISFAIAGIAGFLVPIFNLYFKSEISIHTVGVLDFTSLATGALSLAIGLYDQAKDYPHKVRQFHDCGKAINKVVRRLATSHIDCDRALEPFVSGYERALDECSENHDDIDFELAKAQQRLEEAKGDAVRTAEWRLIRLRWRQRFEVYRLYAFIWCAPPTLGILIW